MTRKHILLLQNQINLTYASQVFRRDSRKLPIGDPDVDWEETIYLNLIVHHLTYKVTLAVYSRTSHKDIQVCTLYTGQLGSA